ncbi:hypothetical protein N473_06940 [Pseudoalteromonas luteoviolacea CPMOR-1]|uniref:Uncharacterized protein n=1 Tax=Pseudoalteromonas luteoviolacea CPMOR-1 TaxID=1365248 RepID=A0A167H3Z8_9GAMM|nr:hypothetical protein [Pseudoalteromonas luteoviolacea]KZN57607.1 hypothetical protein N473_06940 [Pseudoalteromonas luteoviolacea CPMOR-1]
MNEQLESKIENLISKASSNIERTQSNSGMEPIFFERGEVSMSDREQINLMIEDASCNLDGWYFNAKWSLNRSGLELQYFKF